MLPRLIDFARLAVRDCCRALPPAGAPEQHLRAAEAWLTVAHDRGVDGGVSYGYSLRGGWRAPYRETSGYIATTFLRLAQHRRDDAYRQRAIRIARWLLTVQNADGSFSNPRYGEAGIVFDTGQVLFGLVAAHEATGDATFLAAARRAGAWLRDVADDRGLWTRNEHLDTPHAYNTRSAWAVLQLQRVDAEPGRERVARANLDWALANQRENGLFDHCAFRPGVPAFTHTIAYCARGLLESGRLLQEPRYLDAARRCAETVRQHLRDDGWLPGRIDTTNRAAANYVCLTGNCQFAIVWSKLYEQTKDERFRRAAVLATDFVMRTQDLTTTNAAIRGAVKGSHPIWGGYSRFTFPNWATKFFVDAMLLRSAWS